MTYTARYLCDGDLEILENGAVAGYLDFSAGSALSPERMKEYITPRTITDWKVSVTKDDDVECVSLYAGESFICNITGYDTGACIALGEALIKQIEGTKA